MSSVSCPAMLRAMPALPTGWLEALDVLRDFTAWSVAA